MRWLEIKIRSDSNQFHQLALDGRQYRPQLMPALQYCATLADQRPHALFKPQVGAFLDPVFGTLGGSAESAEHGCITTKIDGIITPVSGRDHATVKVQYLGQLDPLEADLRQPV